MVGHRPLKASILVRIQVRSNPSPRLRIATPQCITFISYIVQNPEISITAIRKIYRKDLENITKDYQATAPYKPWQLVFYGAFENMKKVKDFELYLKTGSGKAFAYKRLLNSEVLKKNF